MKTLEFYKWSLKVVSNSAEYSINDFKTPVFIEPEFSLWFLKESSRLTKFYGFDNSNKMYLF